MDYAQQMTENRSKTTCLAIAAYIDQDQHRFSDLVDAFYTHKGKLQDYLMWAINHTVERSPFLVMPHLPGFVHILGPQRSGAVNRGIVRLLRDAPSIPEQLAGEVYAKCFGLLNDAKQPIAVRAFSIKVLTRIAIRIPELRSELVPLFTDIYTYTEKGMHVSARDALHQLGVKL